MQNYAYIGNNNTRKKKPKSLKQWVKTGIKGKNEVFKLIEQDALEISEKKNGYVWLFWFRKLSQGCSTPNPNAMFSSKKMKNMFNNKALAWTTLRRKQEIDRR